MKQKVSALQTGITDMVKKKKNGYIFIYTQMY